MHNFLTWQDVLNICNSFKHPKCSPFNYFATSEIFEENVDDTSNLLITSWLLPCIIKLLWQQLMPLTILHYQQHLVEECDLSSLERTTCRCLFSDKDGLLTQAYDSKY